jgi:glycosyltransferase involved in cell wall biosynthesis
LRGCPSGIDRVELAYAAELADLAPERLRFLALGPHGRFHALPDQPARRFLEAVRADWEQGSRARPIALSLRLMMSGLLAPPLRPEPTAICINVSGAGLHRAPALRNLLGGGAALVALVHDIIPITHPDHVPPPWTRRQRHAIVNLRRHAAAVIANSATTARAIGPMLPGSLPMLTAPLGIGPRPLIPAPPAGGPSHFVCLGTLEPRKNHTILLDVWRRLAERLGPRTPRLLLIGRHGFQSRHVTRLIDRCPDLAAHVEVRGWLPDREVARMLRGARALLMPSLVEGYGLPVAEALAAGVPVICSDIPAHREVGGDVPDYIAPLDRTGWTQAVLDHAEASGPRRAAQLRRLAGWSPPCWRRHVASALAFIDALPVRAPVPHASPQEAP